MKKLLSILLIVGFLAGGVFLGYATQPAQYKINPGDARWNTKLNAGLDALWDNITDFSTLITNWAIEDNMVVLVSATCTYSDADTFTVPGDYTSRLTAGKIVQIQVAAGMVYTTVASSTYAAPTTTVNLTDAVLTNPITRVYVVATRDGLWPNGPGYVVAADYGTDQAALEAADVVAAAAGKQLVIGRAFSVTTDCTLASNVKVLPVSGGAFPVAATKTLTINGTLDAGPYQIFSCTGTGAVAGLKFARPDWWTTNAAPGTTDMTASVNAALKFPEVEFQANTVYYVVTGGTITGSSNQIVNGNKATVKIAESAAAPATQIVTYTSKSDVVINDLIFDVNQSGTVNDQALLLTACTNVELNRCAIKNSGGTHAFQQANYGYGIYLAGAWKNVTINNPYAVDIMYGIITEPSSTGSVLRVNGGKIEYCSRDGVEINVPTGSCDDVVVVGTTFAYIGSNTTAGGFGVGASGAAGLTITNMKVDKCTFIECDNQGVHYEDGCNGVQVTNSYFKSCGQAVVTTGGAAISFYSAGAATRASKKFLAHGNTIYGGALSDYGIFTGSVNVTPDVKIVDNFVEMAGNGVPIKLGLISNYKCSGNTCKNGVDAGLSVRSAGGIVIDNECYDDQTPKTQLYGIEYNSNALSVRYSGNKLSGNLTGPINQLSVPAVPSDWTLNEVAGFYGPAVMALTGSGGATPTKVYTLTLTVPCTYQIEIEWAGYMVGVSQSVGKKVIIGFGFNADTLYDYEMIELADLGDVKGADITIAAAAVGSNNQVTLTVTNANADALTTSSLTMRFRGTGRVLNVTE